MRTLPKRHESQGAEVSFMSPFQENKQSWCGHSLDVNRPPRTNCNQCWSFFFIQNSEFTQSVGAELLKPGGVKTVYEMYGEKFLKKAKWFFDAVAKAKALSDSINKEIDEQQLVDTDVDLVIPSEQPVVKKEEEESVA